jgi:hypothetical protein
MVCRLVADVAHQDSDVQRPVWDDAPGGFPSLYTDTSPAHSTMHSSLSRGAPGDRFGGESFAFEQASRDDVWRGGASLGSREELFFNDASNDFMSALDTGLCLMLCAAFCLFITTFLSFVTPPTRNLLRLQRRRPISPRPPPLQPPHLPRPCAPAPSTRAPLLQPTTPSTHPSPQPVFNYRDMSASCRRRHARCERCGGQCSGARLCGVILWGERCSVGGTYRYVFHANGS